MQLNLRTYVLIVTDCEIFPGVNATSIHIS